MITKLTCICKCKSTNKQTAHLYRRLKAMLGTSTYNIFYFIYYIFIRSYWLVIILFIIFRLILMTSKGKMGYSINKVWQVTCMYLIWWYSGLIVLDKCVYLWFSWSGVEHRLGINSSRCFMVLKKERSTGIMGHLDGTYVPYALYV